MKFSLIVAFGMISAVTSAHAQGQSTEFYKGKTLEILVGFAPGGAFDTYARAIATAIAPHIPGIPQVIVKNMPGAGSMRLAMYLQKVAARDGLTMGTFSNGLIVAPLIGSTDTGFNAADLTWIGSPSSVVQICATWHASKYRSMADLKAAEPAAFGATGTEDSRYIHTAILKNMFGANLKIVSGYQNSPTIRLAMERGELDGNCGDHWSSLKSARPDWIRENKLNMLAQFAFEKHPDLPHVPLPFEFATSDEQRAALRLLLGPSVAGIPYAAPPGIPADRATALRRAFDLATRDPKFIAFLEKANFEVSPTQGEAIGKVIAAIYRSRPTVIEAAKQAMR